MKSRIRYNQDQLALPFGERAHAALSYEARERVFWALAGVSILSLFVYFYAINAIARNTAIRENIEAHLADSGSRIGSLEFTYIGLKNQVTAETARERGFAEARKTLYVSRPSSATALTLNR